jgi:hypothetical protein
MLQFVLLLNLAKLFKNCLHLISTDPGRCRPPLQPFDGIYAAAPATVRGQPSVLSVDAKVPPVPSLACRKCKGHILHLALRLLLHSACASSNATIHVDIPLGRPRQIYVPMLSAPLVCSSTWLPPLATFLPFILWCQSLSPFCDVSSLPILVSRFQKTLKCPRFDLPGRKAPLWVRQGRDLAQHQGSSDGRALHRASEGRHCRKVFPLGKLHCLC